MTKTINFEKTLNDLNDIVEKMEKGDMPLETALKSFEKGITLIQQSQKALTEAEQKVKILIEKSGKQSLVDFYDEDEEDDE